MSRQVASSIAQQVPVIAIPSINLVTSKSNSSLNTKIIEAIEKTVLDKGCLPALTGILNGKPTIGIDRDELLDSYESNRWVKVGYHNNSSGNVSLIKALTQGMCGFADLNSTILLSRLGGLKFVATGLLDHVEDDCWELTKNFVTVSGSGSGGPDSVTDCTGLARNGVYVSRGEESALVAKIMKQKEQFSSTSGIIDLNVLNSHRNSPEDDEYLERYLGYSRDDKEVGSLLLEKALDDTINSNLHQLIQNCKRSCDIAIEYQLLNDVPFMPSSRIVKPAAAITTSSTTAAATTTTSSTTATATTTTNNEKKFNGLIFGPITYEMKSVVNSEECSPLNECHRAEFTSEIKGLGHEIVQQNQHLELKFVSAISDDVFGNEIYSQLNSKANYKLHQIKNEQTLQKIRILNSKDELIISTQNNSKIMDKFDELNVIESELQYNEPKVVLVDSRLSFGTIKRLVTELKKKHNYEVIFKPSSVVGAAKKLSKMSLPAYPNNMIFSTLISVPQLKSLHRQMDDQDRFDVENWFPVVDGLGINTDFKTKLEKIQFKFPIHRQIQEDGILQASVSLLPFIPRIMVRAKHGVYLFSIHEDIGNATSSVNSQFSIKSVGKEYEGAMGKKNVGVLFEFFETDKSDPEILGSLVAELGTDLDHQLGDSV